MFRARDSWFRALNRFKTRSFSGKPTASGTSSTNNGANSSDKAESSLAKYDESYRQLDNLNFMTAAKILFTDPPKKKKFGLDFHLVQFFFALMPSFAVYLVAQYARYEMRRMEEELEQKKKKEEEEAKAKELELKEKESESVPGLLEVKTRLDKLEEAVKEIVVESKKQSSSGVAKDLESGNHKKNHVSTAETSSGVSRSESSESKERDRLSRQKSVQDKKERDQGGGVSEDDKR